MADHQAQDSPDDPDDWDDWEEWVDDDRDDQDLTVTVTIESSVAVDDAVTAELLRTGEMELVGRMPWSSNGTYLVRIVDGEHHTHAIYKPEAGERPLWDFPRGLWRREVATYELARHLGWPVVPPTVERDDGPLGAGSAQFFIDAEFDQHYFTFRDDPGHEPRLRRICLLDLVANNTDRKAGHCLLGADGRVWAIDNGLSFHQEFKVRTVLWDYGGELIDAELHDALCRLVEDGLPDAVARHLDRFETDAVLTRARAVADGGRYPSDPTGRRYPWPLV